MPKGEMWGRAQHAMPLFSSSSGVSAENSCSRDVDEKRQYESPFLIWILHPALKTRVKGCTIVGLGLSRRQPLLACDSEGTW